MSERRDRIRKSLAEDLRGAVRSSILDQETAADRWDVVAMRIDLLIDQALLDIERSMMGKPHE